MTVQVPVEEAARRLGVSSITVRRKIKRGLLNAVKVETAQGHQWMVELNDTAAQSPDEAAHEQPTTPLIEQVSATEALARELARVEAHNQDLRAQLDDRAREIERLHTLVSQALRALPAPAPGPAAGDEAVSTPASTHNDAPTNQESGRLGWWPRLLNWAGGA
jgi:excisionase family DNA binding protein